MVRGIDMTKQESNSAISVQDLQAHQEQIVEEIKAGKSLLFIAKSENTQNPKAHLPQKMRYLN